MRIEFKASGEDFWWLEYSIKDFLPDGKLDNENDHVEIEVWDRNDVFKADLALASWQMSAKEVGGLPCGQVHISWDEETPYTEKYKASSFHTESWLLVTDKDGKILFPYQEDFK
jgi:hypothetical protein